MATFEETFRQSVWKSSPINPIVYPVARQFWQAGAASRDAEVARFHAALAKINDIRNSIIGYQNVNFSAHIYSLVAALNEAGFEGMGYEEASKLAQTQVELIADLRSKIEAVRACARGWFASPNKSDEDRAKEILYILDGVALGKQGERK